jgi:hypothetical protein
MEKYYKWCRNLRYSVPLSAAAAIVFVALLTASTNIPVRQVTFTGDTNGVLWFPTTPIFPYSLIVTQSVQAGSYKSSDGTAGLTTNLTLYTRTADNSAMLTNAVTFKNGLLTTWTY